MVQQITIRKGLPSDLPVLQQLFADTISKVCSSDYDTQQIQVWTSSIEDKKRWSIMISNQFVLVAQLEKKVLGFATLDNGNYIDFLYVHKDYQRQGLAYQLYTDIENEAIRQKQTELTSDVSKTARPFFEKVGFEVINEQTVVRQNVELTNYKMKKKLNNKSFSLCG
jgi:putative acetyltransferase